MCELSITESTKKSFQLSSLMTGFDSENLILYVRDDGNHKSPVAFNISEDAIAMRVVNGTTLEIGPGKWDGEGGACNLESFELDRNSTGGVTFSINRMGGGLGTTDIRPMKGEMHWIDLNYCGLVIYLDEMETIIICEYESGCSKVRTCQEPE